MTDPTQLKTPTGAPRRAKTDPNVDDAAAIIAERRASEFATHGDPTLALDSGNPMSNRPGVQWVRPTDLAARAAGTLVDRGAALNTRLHDAVLDGVREGRAQLQERLVRRQTQLVPETTQTTTHHRSLGRAGVSR